MSASATLDLLSLACTRIAGAQTHILDRFSAIQSLFYSSVISAWRTTHARIAFWPRWRALFSIFAVAAEMAVPLFTQPSASKEELQNACSFIQSECSFNRRPYNLFSVVCGGLRPLFSGSPVEAEILASISSLLSPPSKDGSWYRRPSARYVPSAQEALFTCGGLDSLVASLGYPSALNKPAIARCIALAVGLQSGHISRSVELGVISSLSDALSTTLTSGIFHNNCSSFAMAIEALTDSNSKPQNDAEAVGICVSLVNAILTSIGGTGREVVHTYLWAVAAMCRGNYNVISSFARAGAPSAAVRTLASCSSKLAAEAALDVLSFYMHTPEAPAFVSSSAAISAPSSATFDHNKLAAGALLSSEEAVTRLALFARAASKHGRSDSLHTALTVMLAAATVDFATTASVLERMSSKSSRNDKNLAASSSSDSALVQACITCLMNDRCPQLCIQLLAKLVPISAFALELFALGGISVLFARLYSNSSLTMLTYILPSLVLLASQHQEQFVLSLENMLWCEVSVAVEALLQIMKGMRENRKQQLLLADAVQLLQIFASIPTNFHFRMMSFMLSSQAIEILLRTVINPHVCSAPELRCLIITALEFVVKLMEFDLSIKPVYDSKTSPSKPSAVTSGGFIADVGEYQSAASLVDVAPILPHLLNLFASCINSITAVSHSANQGTSQEIAAESPSSIDHDDVQRAILRCILKVLTFLVDNPLAADVTGAAGGVELLMKLFLFGEEEHKAAVLVVLRMLHAHNDMNRQILARLIGKLPHATKSLGKTLLKDHHPWLRSPLKPGATAPAAKFQGAAASSATCALPSVFKSHTSAAQSDAQNGFFRSDSRTLRSQPILHQLSRSSLTAPSPTPSAAPLPYLLAPLSKLFENYSSSDRMSAKHLRKLCHDFAVKKSDSRAIMRCYADISAASGDELSFTKFVEVLSAACSSLQLSLSQFLGEIGARNARAVSIVVDVAHERSLASRRLEQTKQVVCLQVDGWRDRQFMKRQNRDSPPTTEQHLQHQQPTSQALRAHFLLKARDTEKNFRRDNDELRPPRSQNMQQQPQVAQVQRSRLRDEAALWAEFGCQYVK